MRLLRNNTVLMSAALDVAVPARTWIWKGVNFGFLGCLKISSCGGQIVTYSAHIDMKVAFQGNVENSCSPNCVTFCRAVVLKLKSVNRILQCWGSDPHVFRPPGSVSQGVRVRIFSGSFPFLINVLSGVK